MRCAILTGRVREGSGREEIEYIAEHKSTGLSISLLTRQRARSRGYARDGTTGEDVTLNIKTIRSIPLPHGRKRA